VTTTSLAAAGGAPVRAGAALRFQSCAPPEPAAMSRSGIFRWSKAGGFNVQPRDLSTHQRRDEYDAALRRWRELRPKVRWDDFLSVTDAEIAALGPDVLVVLDPPYEDTSDTYGKGFDTHAYWKRVRELRMQFDVLIFDTVGNLKRHGITPDGSAALSVHGKKKGAPNVEGYAYLPKTYRLPFGLHLARKSSRPGRRSLTTVGGAR
jgi:hypothetical protein